MFLSYAVLSGSSTPPPILSSKRVSGFPPMTKYTYMYVHVVISCSGWFPAGSCFSILLSFLKRYFSYYHDFLDRGLLLTKYLIDQWLVPSGKGEVIASKVFLLPSELS